MTNSSYLQIYLKINDEKKPIIDQGVFIKYTVINIKIF